MLRGPQARDQSFKLGCSRNNQGLPNFEQMSSVAPLPAQADGSNLPREMRCAFFEAYGKKSLGLGNLPCPKPADLKPGQVLLQVAVVALNPADYKMRRGEIRPIQGKPSRKNPIVMGYDCSGIIVAAGPNVNPEWKVGDEVCCVAMGGALAPFTIAYEDNLARKPPSVSHADAASLATAAMTALQQLKLAGADGRSDRILITAGAGGVGHLAIQLAKNVFKVKTVATTASGPKHAFVKECGADIAIDYRAAGTAGSFVQHFKQHPMDAALDCTGETKQLKKIIRPGGVVVGILGIPESAWLREVVRSYHMPENSSCVYGLLDCITCCAGLGSTVRVKNIIALPRGWELQECLSYCEQGVIKPAVDRIYSLEQAVAAMDYLEGGRVVGKVLVEVMPGVCKDTVQRNPL